MSAAGRPLRVALPCTGLGRQRRGFEAFAREMALALATDRDVEITRYGGGGAMMPGERAVWNLPRSSPAARVVGALTGRGEYFVEQASFFAAFVPRLVASRPDVVYFADLNLGNACWHWRRLTGQRYRLLFYNGGATTMPYTRCDVVQQVSPEHLDAALARGEKAERMVLLPHGIAMPAVLPPRDDDVRAAIRRELGVGTTRAMLLSVGVLGLNFKRMDVLVDAVAALGDDRPHLVMLGETTPETPALSAYARARLGDAVTLATWPRERMPTAYAAADAFALLSLHEGFGLAYLEALAAGLPCAAHDTATTRYIFGPHAMLGDSTEPAAAAALIRRALASAGDDPARVQRHAWARARFSWEVLAPRYRDMLLACAAGERQPGGTA
ncbi:MAG: glycosyltransferase family 4 protein [Gemmatimonadaceae bacterium]